MILTSPISQPISIRPVHANQGLIAEFRERLELLIDAMQISIEYHLLRSYEGHAPKAAMDAILPASFFKVVISRLVKTWLRRFEDAAPMLAKWYTGKIQGYTDLAQKEVLKKAGFIVSFKPTKAMEDVVQATIHAQVGKIKSIAEAHLGEVETLVMESIARGRDIGGLAEELRIRYNLSKKRAAFIAAHQNNQATANMVRVRQMELGIKARWKHSGGGKHPRPDHLAANGRIYDPKKGCLISGKYILPGQLYNCGCVSQGVVV